MSRRAAHRPAAPDRRPGTPRLWLLLAVGLALVLGATGFAWRALRLRQAAAARERGEQWLAQRRPAPARAELGTATRLDPGDARAWIALSVAARMLNDDRRARDAAARAAFLEPRNANYQRTLGLAAALCGVWEEAE